jgi:hypothetical protein
MLSDEQLNEYRVSGTKVRVIRDNVEANDVRGIVVAWNETELIIRKQNRNVVKLPRSYAVVPMDEPRPEIL